MSTIVTVTNGNLFALALQYMGDATQATRIAQANNLDDFNITSQVTLTIPAANASLSGGAPQT